MSVHYRSSVSHRHVTAVHRYASQHVIALIVCHVILADHNAIF